MRSPWTAPTPTYQHLKTHLQTHPGAGRLHRCQDRAWNFSSSSSTTWVSKVYLNQFVTENILGMKNDATGRDADAAHYAYEVLARRRSAGPTSSITSSHIAYGCRHYPRGVTSALWWLWPLAPSGS